MATESKSPEDLAFLILEDGTIYRGRWFGFPPPMASSLRNDSVPDKSAGEIVFNTGMTGYHEILTDPSYSGQLVTMTYPLIGNYGADDSWSEVGPEHEPRPGIKAAGLVVRSLYEGPVPKDRRTLREFLENHGTPGITDVDTRGLTLRIREGGSPNGLILRPAEPGSLLSEKELAESRSFLDAFPPMLGRNLITEVGASSVESINPEGNPHIVLFDCGAKANIVRELTTLGCRVSLVPSDSDLDDIVSIESDAILYSNGPGDPGVLESVVSVASELVGRKPLFGICLGHQIISQALGAKTRKMKFGHHGVNHPVRDEQTKQVFVTSQNHGFDVDEESLPENVEVWFRNANDGTVEGIRHKNQPILTVQFHPEAAPGPRDSQWIFKKFLDAIPDRKRGGRIKGVHGKIDSGTGKETEGKKAGE